MIKLEVGKEYRTRGGHKVTHVNYRPDGENFGYEFDAHVRGYTPNKCYKSDGTHGSKNIPNDPFFDIVALWNETDTPPSPEVSAIGILSSARSHMEDRALTYDSPEGERSMARTVEVFNLFHGTELTEAQGWHFMQILKDVRLFANNGYHSDSAEDCTAYSALKAEAKSKEIPHE